MSCMKDSGFSVSPNKLKEKQNAGASRGFPRFTDATSISKPDQQTRRVLQFWVSSFGKERGKFQGMKRRLDFPIFQHQTIDTAELGGVVSD